MARFATPPRRMAAEPTAPPPLRTAQHEIASWPRALRELPHEVRRSLLEDPALALLAEVQLAHERAGREQACSSKRENTDRGGATANAPHFPLAKQATLALMRRRVPAGVRRTIADLTGQPLPACLAPLAGGAQRPAAIPPFPL
jgi:hypothetical protein